MSKIPGSYKILEKIGQGGMSEVFLAEKQESELSRKVVVKKLLSEFAGDEEFKRLFKREATLLINLQHPNLVQVYDYIESGKNAFIAMEHVDGVSLGDLKNKITGEMLVYIVIQVLSGLAILHNDPNGEILHRDISPDNILIGKNGEVKLADFGIAKQMQSKSVAEKTAIIGKMKYVPPELIAGKTLNQYSDLYSLAKLIWEIISDDKSLPETIEEKNLIIDKERDVYNKQLLKLIFNWLHNDIEKRSVNAKEAIALLESKLTVRSVTLAGQLGNVVLNCSAGNAVKHERKTRRLDKQNQEKKVFPTKAALLLVAIVAVLGLFALINRNVTQENHDETILNGFMKNKIDVTYSLLPVDSKRKASIEIDGKDAGNTPDIIKLVPGRHTIKLVDSKNEKMSKTLFLLPGANGEIYFNP